MYNRKKIVAEVRKRIGAGKPMPEWLRSMSKEKQQAYFAEHPESLYNPGGPTQPSVTQTRPNSQSMGDKIEKLPSIREKIKGIDGVNERANKFLDDMKVVDTNDKGEHLVTYEFGKFQIPAVVKSIKPPTESERSGYRIWFGAPQGIVHEYSDYSSHDKRNEVVPTEQGGIPRPANPVASEVYPSIGKKAIFRQVEKNIALIKEKYPEFTEKLKELQVQE